MVHFLIRKESAGKVAELREYWRVNAARTVAVNGDLTSKKLGVSTDDIKKLEGQVGNFYHLATVYDQSPTRKAKRRPISTARAIQGKLPRQSMPDIFTM